MTFFLLFNTFIYTIIYHALNSTCLSNQASSVFKTNIIPVCLIRHWAYSKQTLYLFVKSGIECIQNKHYTCLSNQALSVFKTYIIPVFSNQALSIFKTNIIPVCLIRHWVYSKQTLYLFVKSGIECIQNKHTFTL